LLCSCRPESAEITGVAARRDIAAFLRLALAATVLLAPGAATAQSATATGGGATAIAPLDARDPKLTAIERRHGGTHVLPISKATLRVGPEFDILLGDQAQQYFSVKNGLPAVASLEAVLVHLATQSTIYLVVEDSGYITLDDWASVDPARLLRDMRSHQTVANIEAAPSGLLPVTVIDWRQPPLLDRQDASVFWSVDTTIGGKPLVQATLLMFTAHGEEKLVWIGDRASDARGILGTVKNALSPAPDGRYRDHRASDRVAGYGVAAAVTEAVGLGRRSMIGGASPSLHAVETAAMAMVALAFALFCVAFRLNRHKKRLAELKAADQKNA
jgi:uncharacterized membrane-anchored protein